MTRTRGPFSRACRPPSLSSLPEWGASAGECHDGVDGSHFPRGNTPRPSVTCLSCHQVHGSTLLFPALRERYPLYVIDNADVNPHGGRIFCLSCHRDSPQGGQEVTFRSEGDATSMCRRCHQEVEHHPLGVGSSPGTWKMDFSDLPLEEEKITCVTCHDPYECDSVVTRDNPRFLRGGPYNAVEEFCMRCHEGRSIVSLNPHDQIDDEGQGPREAMPVLPRRRPGRCRLHPRPPRISPMN